MRHINGVYTQRYNRLKKIDGPLFRGRYKAILVEDDSHQLHLSRYIQTRSAYEYSHHIKIGREFGVSDNDIRAMIAETQGRESDLEPLAKAVLRAAREMTLNLAASEETMQALKAGMDLQCLTDLVVTIGYYNCVVRYLETMQVDVEEGYLPYLEEFPLPGAAHVKRK